MKTQLYKICLGVFLISTFDIAIAADYFPPVSGLKSEECYREVESCRVSRKFLSDFESVNEDLVNGIVELENQLFVTRDSIEGIEAALLEAGTEKEAIRIESLPGTYRLRRKLRRLDRRYLKAINAFDYRDSRIRKIQRKMKRVRSRLERMVVEGKMNFEKNTLQPLEERKRTLEALEAYLVETIEKGYSGLAQLEVDKMEKEQFVDAFCKEYLAACLPPIGNSCFQEDRTDLPSSVLYPEYYLPNYIGREASVMFRSLRDCTTGEEVSNEEVVVLDGTMCNYTCRSRFPEQCLADGSYDVYAVEECFDHTGERIKIDQPESGRENY